MTGQQRRLDLQIEAAEVLGSKSSLPIEHAHLFGRGVSQTEVRQASARVLAQLVTDPGFWDRVARRVILAAVAESLPSTYTRRAEGLEQIGTVWADEAAVACRRHAWLIAQGLPDDLEAEVDEALDVILAKAVV